MLTACLVMLSSLFKKIPDSGNAVVTAGKMTEFYIFNDSPHCTVAGRFCFRSACQPGSRSITVAIP